MGRLHSHVCLVAASDFNPRPTCVGRPGVFFTFNFFQHTSIHAPHAWGDSVWGVIFPKRGNFNPRPTCVGRRLADNAGEPLYFTSIHAPHAWGDIREFGDIIRICKLQSTPHMRGATRCGLPGQSDGIHFNPRPTCVGRPAVLQISIIQIRTSIHAPHAWGDRKRP